MKKILFFFALLLALVADLAAQRQHTPQENALFNKAMTQINTRHVTWVKRAASEMNAKNLPADSALAKATNYAVLGSMSGADIEALAFLVLMQSSKSAQEDLKAIMAQVKAINNAKEKQRELLNELQRVQSGLKNKAASEPVRGLSAGYNSDVRKLDSLKRLTGVALATKTTYAVPKTKAELDTAVDKAKSDLDSMSEMGEMESLRLQMAMDRMSKMMSTLSNLLKKIEKTQDSIIQNLK